jgi:hypothetical protein
MPEKARPRTYVGSELVEDASITLTTPGRAYRGYMGDPDKISSGGAQKGSQLVCR